MIFYFVLIVVLDNIFGLQKKYYVRYNFFESIFLNLNLCINLFFFLGSEMRIGFC